MVPGTHGQSQRGSSVNLYDGLQQFPCYVNKLCVSLLREPMEKQTENWCAHIEAKRKNINKMKMIIAENGLPKFVPNFEKFRYVIRVQE